MGVPILASAGVPDPVLVALLPGSGLRVLRRAVWRRSLAVRRLLLRGADLLSVRGQPVGRLRLDRPWLTVPACCVT